MSLKNKVSQIVVLISMLTPFTYAARFDYFPNDNPNTLHYDSYVGLDCHSISGEYPREVLEYVIEKYKKIKPVYYLKSAEPEPIYLYIRLECFPTKESLSTYNLKINFQRIGLTGNNFMKITYGANYGGLFLNEQLYTIKRFIEYGVSSAVRDFANSNSQKEN